MNNLKELGINSLVKQVSNLESETWRIGEMGSEDDYVTPVVLK